ncbi:MAG: sigma-70 family RNA polymerase sigma factor [Planctomycetes bacterium]|nr:sigma-70 family RNA polymerase sigma factor [Planctomycetota bacterium]
MPHDDEPVLHALADLRAGDKSAWDRLLPLVLEDLRKVARVRISRERAMITIQPTALVNEAFCRLIKAREIDWTSRVQFFAAAALAMRRVLVDAARSRARRADAHRGKSGESHTNELNAPILITTQDAKLVSLDFVELDIALRELAEIEPREARVVDLRFFGGMSTPEIAEVLRVSEGTVKNDWAHARSWLGRRMGAET